MKKINSNVRAILLLIGMSAVLYAVQISIFHDNKDTFFYLLQDIAFLPLQVAIVTVALGWALGEREKKEKLKKTNIEISAFFSEAGTELLRAMLGFALPPADGWGLCVTGRWSAGDFLAAVKKIKAAPFQTDSRRADLAALKALLLEKRGCLLSMLVNPNLLEHDTFTDMLWAVSHLADELKLRQSVSGLPEADLAHLSVDIGRALNAMLVQWVYYMEHLKTEYPYLFSLEVRQNPFAGGGSVVIEK